MRAVPLLQRFLCRASAFLYGPMNNLETEFVKSAHQVCLAENLQTRQLTLGCACVTPIVMMYGFDPSRATVTGKDEVDTRPHTLDVVP